MAVFPMQQILMNWAHLGCWKISLFLFSIPPLNQSMAIENTIWMGKKTESGDWWAGCTMNFFWSWLAVENIPGWRHFWWHLESPTSWDSLSIEWQCRPILWNPTENDAATARGNTISHTWLISMKFTICFRCSGPYTKFLCSLWGIWTVWCHQVPVSILTLFLGDLTFKFKRLPVSYHRNPPLTSVVLNPASVDLRCFARQCRDMSRVVISFCGLALATGPRLSQWGPGWHRGPNTHKSRLPPHTLQFLLASRYSKQHCIDIK